MLGNSRQIYRSQSTRATHAIARENTRYNRVMTVIKPRLPAKGPRPIARLYHVSPRLYHVFITCSTRGHPRSKFLTIPKLASAGDFSSTCECGCIESFHDLSASNSVCITFTHFSSFFSRGQCVKPVYPPMLQGLKKVMFSSYSVLNMKISN